MEGEEGMMNKKHHIVLVHGMCHGAWCWYKVSTLLRQSGHRVTVPDLSASGADDRRIREVATFGDYSRPLLDVMESLGPGEKVVLVGHSLGGLNIALSMDRFPHKVAVAVFVTAFMPDCSDSSPSYVLDQFLFSKSVKDSTSWSWMDCEFGFDDGKDEPSTSMLFGPQFMSSNFYQLCPPEDVTLATTLVRPGSLFERDLSKAPPLSAERYGAVDRVYIVCRQDAGVTEDFQRWMIERSPTKEVKEIEGADHMVMLSRPNQLFQCILQIAATYA